jgi:hypothetical protein
LFFSFFVFGLVGVAILLGFLLWEDLSDTVDIARFGLE